MSAAHGASRSGTSVSSSYSSPVLEEFGLPPPSACRPEKTSAGKTTTLLSFPVAAPNEKIVGEV